MDPGPVVALVCHSMRCASLFDMDLVIRLVMPVTTPFRRGRRAKTCPDQTGPERSFVPKFQERRRALLDRRHKDLPQNLSKERQNSKPVRDDRGILPKIWPVGQRKTIAKKSHALKVSIRKRDGPRVIKDHRSTSALAKANG